MIASTAPHATSRRRPPRSSRPNARHGRCHAAKISAAEAIRNHAPLELAILGTVLFVVALAGWHLHAAFRATPANFPVLHAPPPDPIPADSLRTGYRKSKKAQR